MTNRIALAFLRIFAPTASAWVAPTFTARADVLAARRATRGVL